MSGTIVSHRLRNLTAADRDRIEEITRAVGLFRKDEIAVALAAAHPARPPDPAFLERLAAEITKSE